LNQAPPPPARTLSASAPNRAAGQLPPQECSGSGSAVGVQVRARLCVRACVRVRVRARVYVCVLVCLYLQESDAPAVPEALHMTRMQASGALSTSPTDRNQINLVCTIDNPCVHARPPHPHAYPCPAVPSRSLRQAAMQRALQKIAETLYHEGSLSSVEAVSKEVRCARPK
jgi:hypothetical protein